MKKLLMILSLLLSFSAGLNVHLLLKESVVVERIVVEKEKASWPKLKTPQDLREERMKRGQERRNARIASRPRYP